VLTRFSRSKNKIKRKRTSASVRAVGGDRRTVSCVRSRRSSCTRRSQDDRRPRPGGDLHRAALCVISTEEATFCDGLADYGDRDRRLGVSTAFDGGSTRSCNWRRDTAPRAWARGQGSPSPQQRQNRQPQQQDAVLCEASGDTSRAWRARTGAAQTADRPVDGASACDLSAAVGSARRSLSSQASYAPPTVLTPARASLRRFEYDLDSRATDRRTS
jgi:hypothetical protein